MDLSLKNKKVLVLGLGESGYHSALFLQRKGAKVIVNDIREEKFFENVLPELKNRGIEYILGEHPKEILDSIDFLVISPGVPKDNILYKHAIKKDIEVIGELELAYRYCKVPLIGITGTKGKSTTTTLTGEILRKGGFKVIIAGNIGIPFIQKVEELEEGYFVLEISSFQLENIKDFHVHISAFINFYPDHMDRYKSLWEYKEAKMNIFKNQNNEDWAIGFYDQEEVKKAIEVQKAQKIYFSLSKLFQDGIYLEGDKLIYRIKEREGFFKLPIKGIWNRNLLLNFMTASLIGLILNIDSEIIRNVGEEFKGIPHALEKIEEIKGRIFINDSKATNPISTISAIKSFDKPIFLILGGRDKNFEFNELFEEIKKSTVKKVYLIGETRFIMEDLAKKHKIPYSIENDFESAIRHSYLDSSYGDIILLSPSCASFDMFSNYKERGIIFSNIVRKIKDEEG
ncbi:MAG: UDP-N-acetylmuramoyl-L-alanine--D-glutamate ligase [Dictyoglomaceae bacterium]|nr:UDP-N-acetylmuramoyl-L-alanine--D-glutamate ligase [Dictyoglomaceae bacterium]